MFIRVVFTLLVQGLFYAVVSTLIIGVFTFAVNYPGFLEKKCEAKLKRNFSNYYSRDKKEASKNYQIVSDVCGCIVIKDNEITYSPEDYYVKTMNGKKDENDRWEDLSNRFRYPVNSLWYEEKEIKDITVFDETDGKIINVKYEYKNRFKGDNFFPIIVVSFMFLSVFLSISNIFNYFYPIVKTKMNRHFGLLKRFWIVQNINEKKSYYFTFSILSGKGNVKVTTNGNIENGTWEYINEGKSIILELDQKQTLCHLDITNNKNITLSKDGTTQIISLTKEK